MYRIMWAVLGMMNRYIIYTLMGICLGIILLLTDPLGKFENNKIELKEFEPKKIILDSPPVILHSRKKYKNFSPDLEYNSGDDNTDFNIDLATGDPETEEMANYAKD